LLALALVSWVAAAALAGDLDATADPRRMPPIGLRQTPTMRNAAHFAICRSGSRPEQPDVEVSASR
jgi:hypothetical protein